MSLSPAAKQIILSLLEAGIQVDLCLHEGTVAYKVYGFYKSGTATLVPYTDGRPGMPLFEAHTRYDQKDDISDFNDLVLLNREWLVRREGYTPDPKWAPFLAAKGYIKEKTTWEVVR